MENGGGAWCESSLIDELERGHSLTRQLQDWLNQFCPAQVPGNLLPGIIACWEKSLSMAMLSNPAREQQNPDDNTATLVYTLGLESPRSASLSPGSGGSSRSNHFREQERKEVSKKRKALPKWTRRLEVGSGTMEGPVDDGYSWRKYGQKEILGAKFPRAYYRCTHLKTQGCPATRQVQRSDDNPSIFEITYKGEHSCHQRPLPASGASAAGAETNNAQSTGLHNGHGSSTYDSMVFQTLRANLKVETDFDGHEFATSSFSFPPTPASNGLVTENHHHIFSSPLTVENYAGTSFSPFVSPATSECNYFSACPYHMSSVEGTPPYLTEMASATAAFPEMAASFATLTTSSPMVDWEFALEQLEFNPSFPSDNNFFA